MNNHLLKLQKSPFKSELAGAELVAFQSVASKLHGAIGQEQGRQMWGTLTHELYNLTHQLADFEAQKAAVARFLESAINAMHGNVIATKLAEAGYGEWNQNVTREDGKEGLPAEAGKHVAALYGAKIKFRPVLDKATTTLKQYVANVVNAIELGVDYLGVPVSKLVQACKKAREAANPALVGEAAVNAEVSARGNDLASSFKAATAHEWDAAAGKMIPKDRQAYEAFNSFALIARVWDKLEPDVRDHVSEVLNLTAAVAGDLIRAAEDQRKADEAEKAMDNAPATQAQAEPGVNLADMDEPPQAKAA